MKTIILRLLIIAIIPFCFESDINAQISVFQFRHVPSENIDEFVHRESTYWSQVAQKAVNEGNLLSWSLWERVGGWKLGDKTANFVFVNTYSDAKGLDNMGKIWNPSAVFPDARYRDMETSSLSETIHMIILNEVAQVGAGTPFQYAKVNFAKASDLNAYIDLETSVWMPFVKPYIEGGNSPLKYWSVARVISPGGELMPFNAITVDGFDKMSDAISGVFPTGTTYPSFDEFDKVHTKEYIQLYRLVAASQPKQ